MFRRKLIALDYHQVDNVDATDDNQFKALIVWLEDQKIRHYKIEERGPIRDIASAEWNKAFVQYTKDLGCPVDVSDRNAVCDWMLGYAVRLEYGDNVEKYKSASPENIQQNKTSNPLENMNFDDPDFKAGVMSIATLLQIPPHHDHKEVVKAICLLVTERLSKQALEKAATKSKENMADAIPIDKIELGFDCGDYISNEAAKILRLLQIHELRELQNKVNEAIVAVQALTANPKTDEKLGKVGR